MTRTEFIEANAIAYYRELAGALGGQVNEDGAITWFTTGRRSLPRFNSVLLSSRARRIWTAWCRQS